MPDFTLESILELKDDRYTNFTIYLQHTYCIENLYFWEDVQVYKLEPTLEKYDGMIQNYIITNAPYEINIPCNVRETLLTQFTPDCFDEAAETVLELIRINSFLPWYYTIYNNSSPLQHHHRHSFLSPSISFQDRWHLKSQFNISRPSFSSLRTPSFFSSSSSTSYKSKIAAYLFQRQLVFKFKKPNGFSWLAKK